MRVLALALALLLSFCVLFACTAEDVRENESESDVANSTGGSSAGEETTAEDATEESSASDEEHAPENGSSESVKNYVKMTVCYTDNGGHEMTGEILIKLCPEYAPITVANFKKLVSSGFYDGLTFHRVISDFMIQGGDPKGNGTGSSDPIKGEFAANGVGNTLRHQRGVISMARRGDSYDSGSCQFFIVHKTSERNSYSLDGLYAAFGYVVKGIEHVDGIASVTTNPYNDKPVNDVVILSCTLTAAPDA